MPVPFETLHREAPVVFLGRIDPDSVPDRGVRTVAELRHRIESVERRLRKLARRSVYVTVLLVCGILCFRTSPWIFVIGLIVARTFGMLIYAAREKTRDHKGRLDHFIADRGVLRLEREASLHQRVIDWNAKASQMDAWHAAPDASHRHWRTSRRRRTAALAHQKEMLLYEIDRLGGGIHEEA